MGEFVLAAKMAHVPTKRMSELEHGVPFPPRVMGHTVLSVAAQPLSHKTWSNGDCDADRATVAFSAKFGRQADLDMRQAADHATVEKTPSDRANRYRSGGLMHDISRHWGGPV